MSVADIRMHKESVILKGLHEEITTDLVLPNRVVIHSHYIPSQRTVRNSGDQLVGQEI